MSLVMQPLHRTPIDVVRDRSPDRIADLDRARIVHAAPYAGVVAVFARQRDAGIRAWWLRGRRKGKRLGVAEVTEKNGCSRPIEAGVPGRIFRVRRRAD